MKLLNGTTMAVVPLGSVGVPDHVVLVGAHRDGGRRTIGVRMTNKLRARARCAATWQSAACANNAGSKMTCQGVPLRAKPITFLRRVYLRLSLLTMQTQKRSDHVRKQRTVIRRRHPSCFLPTVQNKRFNARCSEVEAGQRPDCHTTPAGPGGYRTPGIRHRHTEPADGTGA